MRLPRIFDRRRRRYEDLVIRHLDGVLNTAGEARLQQFLDDDPARAVEVRELEAVAALLRAEPLVEPPRSFALPYAPAGVPAPPRPAALRWLQAATATAALVLVTLIGIDLVVAPAALSEAPELSAAPSDKPPAALGAAPPSPDAPATDSAADGAILGAEADVPATADEPLAALGAPPPPDAPAIDAPAASIQQAEAEFAPATADDAPAGLPAAPTPPDEPAIESAATQRVEGEVPAAAPSAAPSDAPAADDAVPQAAAEDRTLAREPEPAPVAAPAAGRSALDWAQLGLGVVTALLALGVALLSWRAARSRA